MNRAKREAYRNLNFQLSVTTDVLRSRAKARMTAIRATDMPPHPLSGLQNTEVSSLRRRLMMSEDENLSLEMAAIVTAASAPLPLMTGRSKTVLTMLDGDVLIEFLQYRKNEIKRDDQVTFTFFKKGQYQFDFSLRHTKYIADPRDGYGAQALIEGFETTVSRCPSVKVISKYRITKKQVITITRGNGLVETQPLTDQDEYNTL